MNDLYSDVSKIPDSEQHRLQCVLEDIFINVSDCPQWVLDIHGAIMRHLDTRQPPTEHTDMTEDAYAQLEQRSEELREQMTSN